MAKLEDLHTGTRVQEPSATGVAAIESIQWIGQQALKVVFRDTTNQLGELILYRDNEPVLDVVEAGRPWSFDGDGGLLRLVSEVYPINVAQVHTQRLEHADTVEPEVKAHLNKEINYWDRRAQDLTDKERAGMAAVIEAERALGRIPRDVSAEQGIGYDNESKNPVDGTLLFLKLEGRQAGASNVTLTKNEILAALNSSDRFRLVIVKVHGTMSPHPSTYRASTSVSRALPRPPPPTSSACC